MWRVLQHEGSKRDGKQVTVCSGWDAPCACWPLLSTHLRSSLKLSLPCRASRVAFTRSQQHPAFTTTLGPHETKGQFDTKMSAGSTQRELTKLQGSQFLPRRCLHTFSASAQGLGFKLAHMHVISHRLRDRTGLWQLLMSSSYSSPQP